MIRALSRDARGASAVEFALVAPTFLMFLFLLLDGARMMFTRQALYELSQAASRCAAVNSALCPLTGSSTVADWAAARGRTRSNLALVSADVVVTQVATATSGICGGQAGMMRAVISLPYRKGTMTLLPQSIVPTTLVATSCFPVSS